MSTDDEDETDKDNGETEPDAAPPGECDLFFYLGVSHSVSSRKTGSDVLPVLL
jgi:hypothetical protein